jgi:hypothetical protein
LADEFYQNPIADFSQGDIFDISPGCSLDPPLRAVHDTVPPHVEEIDASEVSSFAHLVSANRASRALLVNYDCEIAKVATTRWIVCPIIDLSDLPEQDRGNAKRYRIANMFFLPRLGATLPDSVAILNQQTTISKDLLASSKRIATLAVTGRLAFYTQFLRWLTRWELREIECPQCRAKFNTSLALPVRSPNDP